MTMPITARPNEVAEVGRRRRRGTSWTVLAIIEVVLATIVIALDVVVPTFVILALVAVSLAIRREPLSTLGFKKDHHPMRMAARVLAMVVVWSLLQLAVFMPLMNHLTGDRQDLAQFDDIRGNVGLLLGFVVLSWTLAAFGEEIVYRGYLQTRVADVLASPRLGMVMGIAISSILFGLAHTEQGLIGVVVTFLDALFFSAMKLWQRNNLWASVLAHGFNNTIGLIAFFLVGPIYGFW